MTKECYQLIENQEYTEDIHQCRSWSCHLEKIQTSKVITQRLYKKFEDKDKTCEW